MAKTKEVKIDSTKQQVNARDAAKIKTWLRDRGGVLIWESVYFGTLGTTWSTPALTAGGGPYSKPHWQSASTAKRHLTDINQFEVCIDAEVKRFHVAVRMGSQGMSLKVTDGGTRRIHKEVAKAGVGAYHVFDYEDYNNCVIMAPSRVIPLADYVEEDDRVNLVQ